MAYQRGANSSWSWRGGGTVSRSMWHLTPANPSECPPKHGCGAHLQVIYRSDGGLSALINKAHCQAKVSIFRSFFVSIWLLIYEMTLSSTRTNIWPGWYAENGLQHTIPDRTNHAGYGNPFTCATHANISLCVAKAACIFTDKPARCQPQRLNCN